jgi:hypothetical protein
MSFYCHRQSLVKLFSTRAVLADFVDNSFLKRIEQEGGG